MASRAAHARRARRGATAIEFALLMPVFVLIAVGVMDVGWIYWQQAALDVAVHDGCRSGTLIDPGVGNTSMSSVLSTAESKMSTRMDALGIPCDDCTIDATHVVLGTEDAITCTVSRPFIAPGGVVQPASIASTITMRLELQR